MQEIRKMYVKVLSKEMERKDNTGKFHTYFGYRVEKIEDKFVDVVTPFTNQDGKADMKAIPIKIKLTDLFMKKYGNLSLPLLIEVDLDMKLESGKSASFITIDKDKDKKYRVDKNGRQHLVLVIEDGVSVQEYPYEEFTFSDIDTFR